MLVGAAAGVYPNLLTSTTDSALNITVYNAHSGELCAVDRIDLVDPGNGDRRRLLRFRVPDVSRQSDHNLAPRLLIAPEPDAIRRSIAYDKFESPYSPGGETGAGSVTRPFPVSAATISFPWNLPFSMKISDVLRPPTTTPAK